MNQEAASWTLARAVLYVVQHARSLDLSLRLQARTMFAAANDGNEVMLLLAADKLKRLVDSQRATPPGGKL